MTIGAGIAQSVQRRAAGVPSPIGARHFSVLQIVHSGSEAHQVPYPIGTRGSFLGDRVAGA
jgi:hypothetical protein